MTRRSLGFALGLGAAIAALGLVMLVVRAGFDPSVPTRHESGSGPLAITGAQWSMGLDAVADDRWTLGINLCAAEPGKPPVLESVAPVRTVGTYALLGASMRQFEPSNTHQPIISQDGYPPDVPDELAPVAGFSVTGGCSLQEQTSSYTEMLLGIGQAGDGGGGWLGEEISYRVGDRRYLLMLHYVMLVCGPAAPVEYCEAPGSQPTP